MTARSSKMGRKRRVGSRPVQTRFLIPIIPIQIAELYRFGQMFGDHHFGMIQIGDSSGYAQHAIVSARGEIHSTDRHFERPLSTIVERANRPELRRRDLRVVESSLALRLASLFHSFPYLGG